MKSFEAYFDCGSARKKGDQAVDYRVDKFLDLTNKIIPFFKQYPIQGVKSEDFYDFCVVADLIKQKKHLTQEGLDQIRIIKGGKNLFRFALAS